MPKVNVSSIFFLIWPAFLSSHCVPRQAQYFPISAPLLTCSFLYTLPTLQNSVQAPAPPWSLPWGHQLEGMSPIIWDPQHVSKPPCYGTHPCVSCSVGVSEMDGRADWWVDGRWINGLTDGWTDACMDTSVDEAYGWRHGIYMNFWIDSHIGGQQHFPELWDISYLGICIMLI